MDFIDESRRLRGSAPSPEGLSRLAVALGEHVEAVRPLHGGVSASVYELATPARRLVLKRFLFEDAVPLEWERLQLARAAPVPTPEPVAVDVDGSWFGTAALVVSYFEGESMYPPQPETLGDLLARIHATQIPDPVPAVLRRPSLWEQWDPAASLNNAHAAAIRDLQAIARQEPGVFSHCDFHPGNVIVAGATVTGVVDWSNARITPRGLDVGLARCDLAIEPGGDAPERLLAAYEAASGVAVANVPLWDALAAARALEHGDGWVDAWTDAGVPMTAERIRKRATAFLTDALANR